MTLSESIRAVPSASDALQYLLSLPPAMARDFATLQKRQPPEWFATSDPPNRKLGSGGGIAHLLTAAARATGDGVDFSHWLQHSRKMLLMAGGQSRRLPSYAAPGKIMLPFKALRGVAGQRLDQTLLDVQLPGYERVLQHASPRLRVLVTSGDVLLRFGPTLPHFPEVDVLGLGMWVRPEVARDFGVFFARRDELETLEFFLQKPEPSEINELLADHYYLVDTGMWLLSERAVAVLLRRCGWDGERFANRTPEFYELYSGMGLSLGRKPTIPDPEINGLSAAVVNLPEAEFYHLGTNRQLIESVSALENREQSRQASAWSGRQPHPDQHILNAHFSIPLRRQENHTLWIENASVPKTWQIAAEHVLTGIPDNNWSISLEAGQCLDMMAIGAASHVVRPYHIDDAFKGGLGDATTSWMGKPASAWFAARGLSLGDAGLSPETDLQQAAIFPVLEEKTLTSEFVQWLLSPAPAKAPQHRALYLASQRLSAEGICATANLTRSSEQRQRNLIRVMDAFVRNHRWNAFFHLDLLATAQTFAAQLDHIPDAPELDPLERVHERMFRATVQRQRGASDWERFEREAFATMSGLIVAETDVAPADPRCCALDDQIIWARSPVRLDFAGGWSDTPPYCLEYGGAVLNVAVNLNGQPPIQVFAKKTDVPEIVVRSIDLGVERRLTSFAEIEDYRQPDSFSLAKAAFALAGFSPRFHLTGRHATLREQLADFGGGIEVTLLSAVPKGSGLGTSSILAATVLGALSELCGLGWDKQLLFQRTLALEQLLTTGGGWQDQAGGLHRGIKLIETQPGLRQRPVIRWLPEHLLESGLRAGTVLLYYTGITRLAKNILQEIVRGMFLNSRVHLKILDEIRDHGRRTFDALQTEDWETLCAAVRRSWDLNQRLDTGTNPPAVAAILARIAPWLAAAKLLGAGGGGYLALFAKDEAAARRIRKELTENPPNAAARFVDMTISHEGFAQTKS